MFASFSPCGVDEVIEAMGIKARWHFGGGEIPAQLYAAVAEVLTFGDVPSVLFLDMPTPDRLAAFAGVRGLGIAGTARAPQEEFSLGRALAQAGLAAAALLVLLAINLGLGRLWAKSWHRKGKS